MADVRNLRDVYGQETRYCNPFTSITTVENRQDTVDAYERRTERKCELHNPFRRDENCASMHANVDMARSVCRQRFLPQNHDPTAAPVPEGEGAFFRKKPLSNSWGVAHSTIPVIHIALDPVTLPHQTVMRTMTPKREPPLHALDIMMAARPGDSSYTGLKAVLLLLPLRILVF